MTAIPLRHLAPEDMDAAAHILRAALDDRLPWLAGRRTPKEDRIFAFETDGACNDEREPDALYLWEATA